MSIEISNYFLDEKLVNQRFKEMTKQEAQIYFDWFVENIPIRIKILETAIKTSKEEYNSWSADKSPHSLILLGKWFSERMTTRALSDNELNQYNSILEKMEPKYRTIPKLPEQVFSDTTFSLIRDIGMYFGEILRNQDPNIRWIMFNKNRKFFDFQKPVLSGFIQEEICEPLRLVQVFAFKIMENTSGSDYLYKLYCNWRESLTN